VKRLALTLAAFISATPFAAATETPSATTYQPFPKGYGYMEPAEVAALEKAVRAGDQATVREHGWRLWAGIMQPAQGLDWPVWFTWPNTKAAFAFPATTTALVEGAPAQKHSLSLLQRNIQNVNIPSTELPVYPIPDAVKTSYPKAICGGAICDGAHVLFNGDIMIPTESLSQEGFDWIRKHRLYEKSTLDALFAKHVHETQAPQRHIVTKHMFWPVKASGLTAIPVWHDDYDPKYSGYAGYEKWKTLVAVDPSGEKVGQTANVSFLYGVKEPDGKTPWPTVTASAKVYGLDSFYHHKVTEADWASFDDADKAIITAASYWTYNEPFKVGDYLVTVAMHVNTKEIPSWALQSVWWSDKPDDGRYHDNRPSLPQAKGPWAHYLLTDSYGIPEKGSSEQPVAMNPFIELAIHPVATNCNNCHARAGWPTTAKTPGGPTASYQNKDCPDLLATLTPATPCLAPLTLTDFQWIIPDRAGP